MNGLWTNDSWYTEGQTYAFHDQIADGPGPRGLDRSPASLGSLFQQVFASSIHPSSIVTLLVLRQFFKTDYRGVIQLLHDFSDLRNLLQLHKIPHYSTLCYAEQRLLKKGLLKTS